MAFAYKLCKYFFVLFIGQSIFKRGDSRKYHTYSRGNGDEEEHCGSVFTAVICFEISSVYKGVVKQGHILIREADYGINSAGDKGSDTGGKLGDK